MWFVYDFLDTPKDLRPGEKVSTDYVQPGTRSTFNVSDAGAEEVAADGTVQEEVTHGEVNPNHDMGANEIRANDSIPESAETNTPAGALNR